MNSNRQETDLSLTHTQACMCKRNLKLRFIIEEYLHIFRWWLGPQPKPRACWKLNTRDLYTSDAVPQREKSRRGINWQPALPHPVIRTARAWKGLSGGAFTHELPVLVPIVSIFFDGLGVANLFLYWMISLRINYTVHVFIRHWCDTPW